MKKILLLISLLFPVLLFAQTIRYVKEGGAGNKSGSSWANASDDLQLMIYASIGDYEVWVAKGTYLPKRKFGSYDVVSDNATTEEKKQKVFTIPYQVKIYGGFPNTGNPRMSDRDWKNNETILSGDIGLLGSRNDNSTNILRFVSGSIATVDGFTVRDAYDDDYWANGGGAVVIDSSSPKLVNLKITNNYTKGNGAGLFIRTWKFPDQPLEIEKASPLILNCTIVNNTAETHGAGVTAFDSSPTFVNCLITNNTSLRSSGGMFLTGGAHIKLRNVTVAKNQAYENPGGVYILNEVKMELFNSIIYGNTSPSGGISNFNNPHNLTTYFNNSIVSGSVNPFVDMETGDFTPKDDKAAYGKGDNSYYDFNLYGNLDAKGNPRLVSSKIDLGALESKVIVSEITPTNNVLYVKKDATGTGDGSSWANAIPDLAEALRWALLEQSKWTSTNILQIWVAKGSYLPKYPTDGAPYSGSNGRENTFLLVNNTQLYGGFAGTETSLNQRDILANETILSGDLGAQNVDSDNAINVVTAVRLSNLSRLDGFTIRDGNSVSLPSRIPTAPSFNGIYVSQDSGAGITVYNSSFSIVNCIITNNKINPIQNINYTRNGAGLYFINSRGASVVNCLIANNSGIQGVYVERSNVDIINSTISRNSNTGIYIFFDCSVNMSNSIISVNSGANFPSGYENRGTVKNTLIGTTDAWNTLWGTDGGGNLRNTTNPFNNSDNGDYRLSSSSVARNNGLNSLFNTTIYGSKDLADNNRLNGTIDMGAYESIGTNLNAPTASVNQQFCANNGLTLANLTVNKLSGATLNWYASATGLTKISSATLLENNITYYVSQTDGANESPRIAIKVSERNQPVITANPQTNVTCFGGRDGSISVNVTGGTAPYTYSWNKSSSTQNNANDLIAGEHILTVTDANGCFDTYKFTITEPSKLDLSFNTTNVSENRTATGRTSVVVKGGVSPYTYLWSNGATTSSIANLVEANYSVTITDVNGCTATGSIYVDGPPAQPNGLTAEFGDQENTISWAANTDSDLKGYNLYYWTSTHPITFIDAFPSSTLNYTHAGLTNGTTYYYKIAAVDIERNESTESLTVEATPKGPQTISFSALADKTYGDADFEAGAISSSTLQVTYVSSDTLVAKIVDNKVRIMGAGTVNIIAKQLGSSMFQPATNVSQPLTISPTDLLITATANDKVYNGDKVATVILNDNRLGNDTISLAYTNAVFDTKDVGQNKAVSVSGISISGVHAHNYIINSTVSTTGTINPDTLTYVATAVTKVYGDAQPNLTGNVIGFVTGENLSNATTGSLSFTSLVDERTPVGAYDITGSGLFADNYVFNQAVSNATALSVTALPIAVTAEARNKIYGDLDPALTYNISSGNLVNGDAFTGDLNREAGENVGTYNIQQNTLALNNNYTISYVPANFTINKATLSITANNAVRCYGVANPEEGVSYNGFKFNDSANSLATLPVVNSLANATSTAGFYDLVPSGASSNNYDFEYTNGTLTVNALPVNNIVSNKGNSISKGDIAILTASSDNGIAYSWSNSAGILFGENSNVLTIRPLESTTYTLTVTNANGCESISTFYINVVEDYAAVVSENFFTPNGDGINDVWVIKNIDAYPNHTLSIMDKSGREVYKVRNYQNDWNGTFNGAPLAPGTYFYILRFDENQPRTKIAKGFITIVRGK